MRLTHPQRDVAEAEQRWGLLDEPGGVKAKLSKSCDQRGASSQGVAQGPRHWPALLAEERVHDPPVTNGREAGSLARDELACCHRTDVGVASQRPIQVLPG